MSETTKRREAEAAILALLAAGLMTLEEARIEAAKLEAADAR